MAELTSSFNPSAVSVGFGTASLGENCYNAVSMALKAGFRKFDTAETEGWYDQSAVGRAVKDYFEQDSDLTCADEDLQITTKIPPWSFTSVADILSHAAASREELVGFCEDLVVRKEDEDGNQVEMHRPYPLDLYLIHVPRCFDGWHPRCPHEITEPLPLREAWIIMEAVVGIEQTSRRIGLSNVKPAELLDIIQFVKDRQEMGIKYPPPRMPDAVQNFADPLDPAKEIRQICKAYDIEFISYSTLVRSEITTRNPKILAISDRYERSSAEVVLSWALQNDMSVIPRSNNPAHISELANLLTQPPFLNETDLLTIDSISMN